MRRITIIAAILFASCAAWGTACPSGYSNWTSITIPHNASLSADVSNFPYPLTSSSSTGVPLIGFVFCTGNNSGTLLNYLLVGGGVKEWRVSVLVSKTTDQTIWYGAKVLGTDLSNAAGVYSGFKLALLYDANSGTVPTSLTDYSGNNSPTFNGNNATSNTTGFINGGLFYNGAQSLRTNTGAINAITGAVSIVSMYHSTTSTAPGFIASNDNGTNGYGCYSFSNGLTMQVVNGGSESDARFTCPGGSCLGAGTWHSVACVYNGGNATLTASWKLYLDGISQSFSMAATGTTSTGTATTNLVVGAQGTTASNFVSTNLDDTLVYNGALSADFITAFDFAENNPITISLPATAAGPPPHRARES